MVRFEESGTAHHRHQTPQLARLDHLFGLGHDRTVGAVVTNQHFGTCPIDGVDQFLPFDHRRGNGFFNQNRQLGIDALQSLRHMQGIGRGQHQAIWAVLREEVLKGYQQQLQKTA